MKFNEKVKEIITEAKNKKDLHKVMDEILSKLKAHDNVNKIKIVSKPKTNYIYKGSAYSDWAYMKGIVKRLFGSEDDLRSVSQTIEIYRENVDEMEDTFEGKSPDEIEKFEIIVFYDRNDKIALEAHSLTDSIIEITFPLKETNLFIDDIVNVA